MNELFPFQRRGIDFVEKSLKETGASLLADEMGLGKTAQALCVCQRMGLKKILVVTRNGVKGAWRQEIGQWHESARWHVMPSGPGITNGTRDIVIQKAYDNMKEEPRAAVYLILHYDVLRLHIPELSQIKWDIIIADECQDIKNRKAQRTKALKAIPTHYKLGLSGTPLVNRPDELWSVLNWFYPTRKQADTFLGSPYFAGFWKFYEEYTRFTIHPYLGVRIIEGYKNLDLLHATLHRFTIRRLKKAELKDLPDKYYTYIPVELGQQQHRIYKQMEKEFISWVGEQGETPLSAPSVLAQLMRLRMFADAYADVQEVVEDGEVVDLRIRLVEPSAKADALMDIINDTNDKQFVVFTQFRDMVTIIASRLEKAGIPFVEFHGGIKEDQRARAVEQFQTGGAKVFLGTPQAGGVGLTLTAADTVIFVDRSWSPAINLQAEDRLHRIGQKSAVQVITLEAQGTVDTGIEHLLRGKWHMIQQILDGPKGALLI